MSQVQIPGLQSNISDKKINELALLTGKDKQDCAKILNAVNGNIYLAQQVMSREYSV